MPKGFEQAPKKFSSAEEELDYLRERIKEKERELESQTERPHQEEVVSQEIKEYKKREPEEVLTPEFAVQKEEAEEIALDLDPEEHDKQIYELVAIIKEKGIRNAFTVIENLKNPHLEDDFHRFLIAYVKEGLPTGLKESAPLFRSLNMTLYEVLLPEEALQKENQEKDLEHLISSMEQFYAGMMAVSEATKGPGHFSIELAIPNVGEEFIFYASVPSDRQELFEKHILSIFPDAKITIQKNDYNIFNEKGISVGSVATLKTKPIYPLKTYEAFDQDPLAVLLNSFSKIDTEGEGAAIQIVFSPTGGEELLNKYKYALEQVQKGKPLKQAVDIPTTVTGGIFHAFKEAFRPEPAQKKDDPQAQARKEKQRGATEEAVKSIQQKVSAPIVRTNIRLAASSRTEREALDILSDMESAFNQFENTLGNKLKFERLSGRRLSQLLKDFSFRMFDDAYAMPLNLKELTTIMHFHTRAVKGAPQLRKTKAGSAPAPTGLPSEGVVLGVNKHRNTESTVRITNEDRLRHFYCIGQTGTGKSTLLKNMIIQDIEAGHGVCMIDPHGVDILDVLSNVPQERYDDIIYFDPSYTPRPMGLNMLEYDRNFPEQKTFVVNELFSIFQKLYGAVPESMGPMFEQYFRNATMLVIEDPDTGSTLLDVSRVMADKSYRDLKLSHCKNPIVVQFWRDIAEKAGGEAALANIVPYITSKFDIFLANDIMRPIVAQEKSAFSFRKIMDERKILLVNLAKGRLGDINANLIGLIIVGKILMATLSRVDSFGGEVNPFYLYIDEFQNVTTDSISTILSEARKYKLGLSVAHQFIAQLEEDIRDSVFGNVGSISAFRVGSDDAEYLEKQFAPVFTQEDLMNIDNRNAYLRLLVNGRPARPFNIEVLPPKPGQRDVVSKLKELSYLKYGRAREDVEREIGKKY